MTESRPLRRLVLTVDAENYSGRSHRGQRDVQAGLDSVLRQSDPDRHLRSLEWDRQHQGDAVLAVLPPGTVESEAVSAFVSGLYTALHHHNLPRNEEHRLRLRVSVDQGNVALGETGFVGNAVVAACRVRDSDLLRTALKDNPHADLVVAVSDSVYTDVVAHGDHELYRWVFSPRTVSTKNHDAAVWLHVPEPSPGEEEPEPADHGETGVPDPRPPSERAQDPDGDRPPNGTTTFHGTVDLRGAQGPNLGTAGNMDNRFG